MRLYMHYLGRAMDSSLSLIFNVITVAVTIIKQVCPLIYIRTTRS